MTVGRKKLSESKFWKRIEAAKRKAALQRTVFEDDSDEKREARIARARHDRLFFCQTYLPHYFTSAPADFHKEWLDTIGELLEPNTKELRGVVNICPRGFAKTTVAEFAVSLHILVYEILPFICTMFDVLAQAEEVVEAIGDELEGNELLRSDFGDLLKSRAPTKFGSNVETKAGCRVQALGTRSSMRGLKHRQHRPHLFLVDDPESDEAVLNPKLREKLRTMLTSKVRYALEPGGLIWVNQNIVHADCFNAHVRNQVHAAAEARAAGLSDKGYRFRHWTVFEYTALDEQDRSNWEARHPTAFLHRLREEDPDNFAMEMMGIALSKANRIFVPEQTVYYEEHEVAKLKLWHVLSCDPSLGKTDRSDFSGLIDIGTDRDTGITYVRLADLQRRTPFQIVEDWFQHVLDWDPTVSIVEAVAFQEILKTLFELRAEQHGLYPAVRLYQDRAPKELRIKRLERPHRTGMLRFRRDQVELLKQLHLFGAYAHDDGPDALEMAYSVVQVRRRSGLRQGEARFSPRQLQWGRDHKPLSFDGGAW